MNEEITNLIIKLQNVTSILERSDYEPIDFRTVLDKLDDVVEYLTDLEEVVNAEAFTEPE